MEEQLIINKGFLMAVILTIIFLFMLGFLSSLIGFAVGALSAQFLSLFSVLFKKR